MRVVDALGERTVSGRLAGSGIPIFLAGAGILAANPKNVNHDWGWLLVVVGAIATLAGGLMYLLLSTRRDHSTARSNNSVTSDRGGVAAGRDQIVNQTYFDVSALERPLVSPNVVFDGFAPVDDQPIQILPTRISNPSRAEFARVRFVNEPAGYSSSANVVDLHARIEIRRGDERDPLLIVRDGKWYENADRGTGLGKETKSISISCNGETRILDVVMRPHGMNECFGWDDQGFMIREPAIPIGSYHVIVELTASNMSTRTFRFILENPLGVRSDGTVIESSFLGLREIAAANNPSSRSWNNERIRAAIRRIDEFVADGHRILDECGRPTEQMVGADPMHFLQYCLPRINKFGINAVRVLEEVAPEVVGKFQNTGNVTHGTRDKAAAIQQLERWLERLDEVQDYLRPRMVEVQLA